VSEYLVQSLSLISASWRTGCEDGGFKVTHLVVFAQNQIAIGVADGFTAPAVGADVATTERTLRTRRHL